MTWTSLWSALLATMHCAYLTTASKNAEVEISHSCSVAHNNQLTCAKGTSGEHGTELSLGRFNSEIYKEFPKGPRQISSTAPLVKAQGSPKSLIQWLLRAVVAACSVCTHHNEHTGARVPAGTSVQHSHTKKLTFFLFEHLNRQQCPQSVLCVATP